MFAAPSYAAEKSEPAYTGTVDCSHVAPAQRHIVVGTNAEMIGRKEEKRVSYIIKHPRGIVRYHAEEINAASKDPGGAQKFDEIMQKELCPKDAK